MKEKEKEILFPKYHEHSVYLWYLAWKGGMLSDKRKRMLASAYPFFKVKLLQEKKGVSI